MSFLGVLHEKRQDDENLPKDKQYIQEISSHANGVHVIITMLPALAERIHSADSTQHDNTYKRVYGEWKEWEVVIWDKKLNSRTSSICKWFFE